MRNRTDRTGDLQITLLTLVYQFGSVLPAGNLLQDASVERISVDDTSECFDPANETAAVQLLECDCMPTLHNACSDVFTADKSQCLGDFACSHTKVCSGWKSDYCTSNDIF